jgi:PKD repeat protein
VIDAGNPAPLGFLDSTTDLTGKPRVVHGRRDIGAFEYQFLPPVAAITQDLTTATIGQTVHFKGDSSGDPDRGDTLTFDWSTDDGTTGNGSALGHAFTVVGSHTIKLTVTDPTGLSDSTTATVSVTAPGGGPGGGSGAGGPGGGGQGGPGGPNSVATIALSSLTESATTWRLGNKLATITRRPKPPIGTTFSFKLGATAKVNFVFAHTATGRIQGRGCAAPSRANRRARSCRRTLTDATLTFNGHSGTNRVHFEGLLSASRRLRPGGYSVAVTASNDNAQASLTRTLSFRIVR